MRKRWHWIPLLLLFIHFLLRLGFWWYNQAEFAGLNAHERYQSLIEGFQQDLVSIVLVNIPTLLLLGIMAWLPSFRFQRPLLYGARGWFVLGNCFAVAFNCVDIGYYRFGRHRANLDLQYVLRDSIPSFKSLLFGYWYLVILFLLLVSLIVWMAKQLPESEPPGYRDRRVYLIFRQGILVLALLVTMGWIGGGRPVMPSTPLLSLPPSALALAQNSLLTWAYSCFHRSHELAPVHYFSDSTAYRLAPGVHQLASPPQPRKKNVVLFILESFSRCYVMPGDAYKAKTPFLDSLLGKSLFFPHSFANGFSSNQGIVAILGGIPALMDEPFFYSEYANTPIHSLGNILQEQGYSTNFFMGAGNNHFGFGTFAHMTGIEHSYWREDFDNDRLYDGNWGIFDEPFLQYGGRVLSMQQQPFLGVFFTISAHPPYTIPPALRQRFATPGQSAAQRAIAYVDYSLREFFAANQDKPWFRNTLFVFCADHWLSPSDGRTPFSPVNICTIPIFIYDPSHEERDWRPTVAGQVDVVPTVLDRLGYRGTYTGFGRSLLDTAVADSDRYVINRIGETYQIIDKDYVLGYDLTRDGPSYLYHYPADSACRNNLLGLPSAAYQQRLRRLERLLRANIQSYRAALTKREFR
ncbi:MAG TPA: LTA synthase family protein [Puia sp.]|uniref:LTA synthase family protein n=1 Tax=Puia sp. TaxID=2045100 RepID=UPI002BB471F2|nr:LTA synthase family protein [Puia sp.]HVU97278.1 LTA synthase family protein [Puia sp.]